MYVTKASRLKTALALAGLLAFSTAPFAADSMSRDQVKAQKEQIEAEYKSARDTCNQMSGNAKDVCVEQAKGQQKVAKAELDWKQSGKDSDRNKVALAKAEADYAVAKEKCDDLSGNAKDVCVKDAKAAEAKAKADARMNQQVGEARRDANEDKRDAAYKAAVEKCDSLAGDAKASCVASAKSQYGKS